MGIVGGKVTNLETDFDTFENYQTNKWWYFYLYIINAAEICEDKEYIEAKYHPKKVKRTSVSNTSKEKTRTVEM